MFGSEYLAYQNLLIITKTCDYIWKQILFEFTQFYVQMHYRYWLISIFQINNKFTTVKNFFRYFVYYIPRYCIYDKNSKSYIMSIFCFTYCFSRELSKIRPKSLNSDELFVSVIYVSNLILKLLYKILDFKNEWALDAIAFIYCFCHFQVKIPSTNLH